MATVTKVDDYVVGNKRKTVSTVALDSSYPTGGEAITAGDLRLGRVVHATATIKTAATTTVNAASASYDTTNSKLQIWDETPAEVANAADLAGLVVIVEAYGSV